MNNCEEFVQKLNSDNVLLYLEYVILLLTVEGISIKNNGYC